MVLLKGADDVVRRLLPVALDAAGMADAGERLRSLPELSDATAVGAAVGTLESVRPVDPDCRQAVEDACFWCGAACEAAVRNDAREFRACVRAAVRALQEGLAPIRVH